ncbi:MAG TPA: hypothetical protein VM736_05290, partial [Gemmatimonadales bacterium]|nr:hypothetical protein [Gemmatimonadales bacterium]
KSMSRDETFPVDVDEDEALAAKLLALADRASADLREAGLAARTVTVKLRDDDFTTRQASRTLGDAVHSDRAVFAVARRLLARLRAARRRPARLVGVSLSGFVPAAGDGQLSFFDQAGGAGASAGAEGAGGGAETARDRAIAAMIDDVRERFGPDALGRAGGR